MVASDSYEHLHVWLATSALDQMSENAVQQALKNIREKKKVTTVTIAHRYV
jgi:ABC-type multidrug transport system fused ATPase/permease subunit